MSSFFLVIALYLIKLGMGRLGLGRLSAPVDPDRGIGSSDTALGFGFGSPIAHTIYTIDFELLYDFRVFWGQNMLHLPTSLLFASSNNHVNFCLQGLIAEGKLDF